MRRKRSKPIRKSRSARGNEPYRARLAKLRRLIAQHGCEGLLITSANDIRYLSGFCGEDSYALVMPRELFIISDFRFQEELEPVRRQAKVVIRKGPMGEAVDGLLFDVRPKRLGLQAEHASIELRRRLERSYGAKRLRDTIGLLSGLRLIKDATEIAMIRHAAGIQEAAMRAVRGTIRPGQSEGEICGRLETEMRRRGAMGTSFETIVAAGPNSSRPHHRAGPAKVRRGGVLLIDWGARFEGYCSDMTRVFALGRWPAKMAEVYKVVLEAHEAAAAAVRPGIACTDLDAVARRIITKAGYGAQFGHGLGHGIGLNIHEDPRLSRQGRGELRPGMVTTIEPGVYLPGIGGVRIEDDILVTARGGRRLCTLPRDLRWATLHG